MRLDEGTERQEAGHGGDLFLLGGFLAGRSGADGVTALWWKYVGLEGKVVGIDRFGISAPGGTVMKELGMTAENLAAAAR